MSEEISPGGSRIERHDEALPPEPVPSGWAGQELIEDHVERHLGPIESVFHELVSEYVHLDVLVVEATEERPFHYPVTSGMSSRPMPAGDGDEPEQAITRALFEAGVSEVVEADRRSVAKKKRFGLS